MDMNRIISAAAAKLGTAPLNSTDTILVIYCKSFAEVVRQLQRQERPSIELAYSFAKGFLWSTNGGYLSSLSPSSCDEIEKMVRDGYTVTGYWQCVDGLGFTPLEDVIEAAVANKVNDCVLRVAYPKTTAN
jgi:hypothetical protein